MGGGEGGPEEAGTASKECLQHHRERATSPSEPLRKPGEDLPLVPCGVWPLRDRMRAAGREG